MKILMRRHCSSLGLIDSRQAKSNFLHKPVSLTEQLIKFCEEWRASESARSLKTLKTMTNPTSNSTNFFLFHSSNFQLMIFFFVICRQKKVRFPKGKKVKSVDERVDRGKAEEEGPSDLKDPRLAAKERAMLRSLITDEGFSGDINDASAAEVAYEVAIGLGLGVGVTTCFVINFLVTFSGGEGMYS
jgi:hypothetical protein